MQRRDRLAADHQRRLEVPPLEIQTRHVERLHRPRAARADVDRRASSPAPCAPARASSSAAGGTRGSPWTPPAGPPRPARSLRARAPACRPWRPSASCSQTAPRCRDRRSSGASSPGCPRAPRPAAVPLRARASHCRSARQGGVRPWRAAPRFAYPHLRSSAGRLHSHGAPVAIQEGHLDRVAALVERDGGGAGLEVDLQAHGQRGRRRGGGARVGASSARTASEVPPSSIESPTDSSVGPEIRSPFTSVPLEEPRSLIP